MDDLLITILLSVNIIITIYQLHAWEQDDIKCLIEGENKEHET